MKRTDMYMRTYSSCSRLIVPAMAALMLVTTDSALAYATRGTTHTSVNSASMSRSSSMNSASMSRSTSVNSASVNSASVNRSASVNSASVNTANVNRNTNVNTATVNSTTVNVNKNVNVNSGCCYNNVGVGGAVAAGVVAGAVVGTAIAASALPPACSAMVVNGVTYQNCGGAWYQPQYAGSQVTYIVVNPPK